MIRWTPFDIKRYGEPVALKNDILVLTGVAVIEFLVGGLVMRYLVLLEPDQ